MKRLIVLLTMCLGMFGMTFAQTTQKFVTCQIIEKKGKVELEFSQDVKCLGTDYEHIILNFKKKKKKFKDGQSAVSYLSDSWGWILCGNPTPLKKGTMWTMKHEVNTNGLNFVGNMRMIDGSKRYYSQSRDEMYYNYDGSESH